MEDEVDLMIFNFQYEELCIRKHNQWNGELKINYFQSFEKKKDSESFDDLRISLLAVKFLPVSENVEHFLLKPAFLPQNVYIGCWGVKEIHLIPTRPVPRKFPISRK